jgi:sensor histidine kinase YesM
VDGNCFYYIDKSKSFDIDTISKFTEWNPSKEISGKFLMPENTVWLKLLVTNASKESIYFRIDNPRLDSVDIFISNKNGKTNHYNSIGNSFPLENRAFKTHLLISKLPQDSILTVYLRIASSKRIIIPLYLGTANTILDPVWIDIAIDILYFVVLIIILSYNLLLFFRYKEKVYFYYLLATFFLGIFIVFWKGYEVYFPIYTSSLIYSYSTCFASLALLFLLLFSIDFLKFKEISIYFLWYYRLLISFFLYCTITLALTGYSKDYAWLSPDGTFFLCMIILSIFSMISGAIYATSKKIISVRLYLWGFIVNMICLGTFTLPLLGIKLNTSLQPHLIPFGSIIESIFLSLALTNRLVRLKNDHTNVLKKSLKEEEELRIKTQELVLSEQKTMDYRLMALRSVMNPHFLFNCLNSIQFYITKNDKLNALNYLSDFSLLIRSTLNSSIEDKWSLSEEIILVKNFIKLEKIRMDDDLEVIFKVDETIDLDDISVPSLILQPYVENAIEHGLLNKKNNRILKILIRQENTHLICTIEDNGIGREASKKFKKPLNKHKSVAMGITEERLKLINKDNFLGVTIIDLYDDLNNPQGTRIELKFIG